jgi:aminoglycoside 2''-phosphotransferase
VDLERIHEVMPHLEVSTIRVGEDGLVNHVLIVNEELVFRFPRSEAGRSVLEREARHLDLIRRHLSLRVPELVHQAPTCLVYRFIPGVPLSRSELMALDPRGRAEILAQLGTFLRELHAIPPPADGAGGNGGAARQESERLFGELERELLPHMMAWARTWAREHFRPVLDGRLDLGYRPALVHGDIAPYHLCYDPGTRRLVGVIDFGDAGPGDPAVDLGSVINAYGESQLWEMRSVYPELESSIERARFYAGTLELRWGLAAIRSRDPAWFLCHLGYARDVQPISTSGGYHVSPGS